MGKLRSLSTKRSGSSRDDELREAHRRAFSDIAASLSAPEREELVSDALQKLIDACEAYCHARHEPRSNRSVAS